MSSEDVFALNELECRVDESWLGGGICLGMRAEAIEYIRIHKVYAKNRPQTPTSTTENGIRGYILPRR